MSVDPIPTADGLSWKYIFDEIIGLAASSAITQGIITIICLVSTFVMILNRIDVPTILWGFDSLVIGFFFGGKVGVMQGIAAAGKRVS